MTASAIATLLASPRLVDLIIVGVIVEGGALALYRRRTGRGMPVREVIAFLGAGLALLLALRATMDQGGGRNGAGFALAMAVGLAFHVWHVAQQWDA